MQIGQLWSYQKAYPFGKGSLPVHTSLYTGATRLLPKGNFGVQCPPMVCHKISRWFPIILPLVFCGKMSNIWAVAVRRSGLIQIAALFGIRPKSFLASSFPHCSRPRFPTQLIDFTLWCCHRFLNGFIEVQESFTNPSCHKPSWLKHLK